MGKKRTKKTALERKWADHKAPLVEVDPMELGDKRLNPEEAVCREREDILKIESKKRIHGQDELEKEERSLGPRLWWKELIGRLTRLNSGIRVREGSEGAVAIYYHKRRDEYVPSDFETVFKDGFFRHHKYVTGIRKEWIPEWGHVTVDTSLVAHHEVRGWRSVLVSLVKQRVLTYRQAVEEFGEPDSRGRFWHEQLRQYKS